MPEHICTSTQLAAELDVSPHMVRTAVDRLYPDAQRAGRTRLINRSQTLQIAADIEKRLRCRRKVEVSQ